MPDPKKVPMSDRREIDRIVATAGQVGEPDLYAGKRHSTRFAEGMQLEVTTDPTNPRASWGVCMHNISEGGCAFWSRRKLEIRSAIYVREYSGDEKQPWLRGYVTHCTVGIRGFLIGAAFGERTLGR